MSRAAAHNRCARTTGTAAAAHHGAMVRLLLRDVAALLLPRECAGCSRAGSWWCVQCAAGAAGPVRHLVAAGLPVAAACDYPRLAPAVLAFKDHAVIGLRPYMASRLAEALQAVAGADSAVVPVPPSRGALRRRGRDVVGDIAADAARLLGLPFTPVLAWSGKHRMQKGLGREERLRNMDGALVVARPFPEGNSPIVVDDVLTTGATLAAAAAAMAARGWPPAAGAVICATRVHPVVDRMNPVAPFRAAKG